MKAEGILVLLWNEIFGLLAEKLISRFFKHVISISVVNINSTGAFYTIFWQTPVIEMNIIEPIRL